MKNKITLLLIGMSILTFNCFGQIILDEDLLTGVVPTNWIALDEDGYPADTFFSGQGVFATTNWEGVNFGGTNGTALYSLGEFNGTTPATADDWLITDQVALLSNSELVFDLNTLAAGMTFEILIATSIAGVNPVPSDFSLVQSFTTTTYQVWEENIVNLSTYANQSVYLAFRNTTEDLLGGNQVKIYGLRNVMVREVSNVNLGIVSIDLSENSYPLSYLTVDTNFNLYCDAMSTETVSITVENTGLDSVSTFSASYNNGSSLETEIFSIPPLAPGNSTQVTFANPANIDTFAGYFINSWISTVGDMDPTNDTSLTTFMVTSDPDTIDAMNDFYTSFEQWTTGPQEFSTSWWTFENANNDGQEFQMVFWGVGSAQVSDGDISLGIYGDNSTAFTGGDDWAFSPCIYFDQTKNYEVSFKVRVGLNAGAPIAENLDFYLCSDDNSLSTVQTLSSITANDTLFEVESFTFSPTNSGLFNLALHKNTVGVSWWLWIDEFSIKEIPPSLCTGFTVTSTVIGDTCAKGTGEVDITVSGGTGMNTYSWTNGGGMNEDIVAQDAGSYSVTIVDSNLCDTTITYNIPPIGGPPVLVTGNTSVTNCITPNGSATVIVTFANAMPYSYSWDDSQAQTTSVADSLSAGTYTVSVTDGWGCQSSISVMVTNNTGFTASVNQVENVDCYGENTGEINTTVSGGVPPYTYDWSDLSSPTTNGDRDDLSAGIYNITITDNDLCTFELGPITINEPDSLMVTSSSTDASSAGNDGTATVVVSGGSPNYIYSWSNGQTNTTATGLGAGSHTCAITDSKGCTKIETVIVGSPIAIQDLFVDKLYVYPNPTSGVLNVELEISKSMKVGFNMFDVLGEKMLSNSFENVFGKFKNQFDLEDLSNGIYFLEISLENSKSIHKITINK